MSIDKYRTLAITDANELTLMLKIINISCLTCLFQISLLVYDLKIAKESNVSKH